MEFSVVIPTLNGRDQLAACLDAVAAHAPDAELIVVNGPSADGTTGMVRERDTVDVLIETSDRRVTVARNAGINVASHDIVAIVDYDNRIDETWTAGIAAGLEHGDVVTGPIHSPQEDTDGDTAATQHGEEDVTAERAASAPERRTIAGREVTYFSGGNVAFRRSVLRDLDGFDEYLQTGGSRDAAHRLASTGHAVAWEPRMAVHRTRRTKTAADGGQNERDWGWKYRALSYRLIKNYGIRPSVVARTGSHAIRDATSVARDVIRGEATPSGWVGNGRDVVMGIATGVSDGLVARTQDRSPARNPHGISRRADRAVAMYDERNP